MIEQGSPEWFAQRCGKVTASRVADVIARTKTGWGASRTNYMAQLIAERLTGRVEEGYTNAAMQWGKDTEPMARAAYSFRHDVDVSQVGFAVHPTITDSGASPDGLVGADGLVEIKCPNTATHIDTLLGASIPDKYLVQMQWQMACTDRQWCDFVSFDPRLPEPMRMLVQRIERDHKRLDEITAAVASFLGEIAEKIAALRSRYDEAA
jgi:putative phage-type endonuclease